MLRPAAAACVAAVLLVLANPSAAAPEGEVATSQEIALSPQDLGLLNRVTWGAAGIKHKL